MLLLEGQDRENTEEDEFFVGKVCRRRQVSAAAMVSTHGPLLELPAGCVPAGCLAGVSVAAAHMATAW
jgi:hypothetical protein